MPFFPSQVDTFSWDLNENVCDLLGSKYHRERERERALHSSVLRHVFTSVFIATGWSEALCLDLQVTTSNPRESVRFLA